MLGSKAGSCALIVTAMLSSVLAAHYSAQTAYQHMLLSGAAYSDAPQACLSNNSGVTSFKVDTMASVKCDWFNSDCYGYTAISHQLQTSKLTIPTKEGEDVGWGQCVLLAESSWGATSICCSSYLGFSMRYHALCD